MATGNSQEQVNNALALLPKKGEWVEFDDFKAKLYEANPEKGRDVFAHLIKRDLVSKKLDVNTEGRVVVMLARVS